MQMKRAAHFRSALLIIIVLILSMSASACDTAPESKPRLTETYIYSPGAQFQTNMTNPQRMVRCSIVFEVIDEEAITELEEYNYAIRNAVLIVLGRLTIEELSENRDLEAISQRLVDQVNEAIVSNYPLIIGAYFTDFLIT